jgi:hypothetical protein
MAPYNMANVASTLELRTLDSQKYSMDPLTPTYRAGLIPIAIFACMSLVSVAALLGFITHRMISWRRHYRQYVGKNSDVRTACEPYTDFVHQ